ncbi:MAG TPA: GerMN domain-containing protein [Clostridiaceae bacterium]|nr:GerMN domain-containing protein [Clostridiaceae bacterium]
MKRFIILIVLLLSLLAGCGRSARMPNGNKKTDNESTSNQTITEATDTAENQRAELLKAKDFFLFEENVFMDFKGTGNEFAEYKTYVDYVKDDIVQIRSINPGTVSVFVYQYKDGSIVRLFSRGETYYLYDYTSMEENEEIIIKEPIKIGTTWSVGESTTRSITAIDKEVSTPSGKYKALEITTESPNSIIKDYYVKDIGKVKSEFVSKEDKSFTVISELQSIEKNASFVQDIKFYYPDFINDRIISSVKTIHFRTNQDIKKVFEDGLKEPLQGQDLKGTLTPNVKILDIRLDDMKGIVAIDFSSELVKEMNAGTSYELMILDCIANTFGDYFQKDKVIITLEGKPYSSGHILMREGEYITVSKEKVK